MTVIPVPGSSKCRILLVEDDDGDALLVEELLLDTDLDHSLVHRRTLADARAELAEQGADCVLLDLHLPDASGLNAVEAVLKSSADAAVIVLTGLAESQAGVEALAAGAQDYLVKGKVEPELLQRAVRYAVQRKQAERANSDLRAGRLRAAENARLERGLLPDPMLRSPGVTATSRYLPGRESPSSAATSSTWSRPKTAGCTRSSATSAGTVRTPPRWGCACASPGAPSRWAATAVWNSSL